MMDISPEMLQFLIEQAAKAQVPNWIECDGSQTVPLGEIWLHRTSKDDASPTIWAESSMPGPGLVFKVKL